MCASLFYMLNLYWCHIFSHAFAKQLHTLTLDYCKIVWLQLLLSSLSMHYNFILLCIYVIHYGCYLSYILNLYQFQVPLDVHPWFDSPLIFVVEQKLYSCLTSTSYINDIHVCSSSSANNVRFTFMYIFSILFLEVLALCHRTCNFHIAYYTSNFYIYIHLFVYLYAYIAWCSYHIWPSYITLFFRLLLV